MGHEPLCGRMVIRRMSLICLIAVSSACLASSGTTRVVVDYDGTIAAATVLKLFDAAEDDLKSLLTDNHLVSTTVFGVKFLHRAESPYAAYARRAQSLLTSIKVGGITSASDLSKDAQAAVGGLMADYFGDPGSVSAPKTFAIQANAAYRISIGGKESTLSLDLDSKDRPKNLYGDLLKSSTRLAARVKKDQKKPVTPFSMRFDTSRPRYDPSMVLACSEFLKGVADEDERQRQSLRASLQPLLAELERQNESLLAGGLPDGNQSMQDLPEDLRNSLLAQVKANYKAFGFTSEEEATAAWGSAELRGSGVIFMMTFGAEGDSGPQTIMGIEVTRTGAWN